MRHRILLGILLIIVVLGTWFGLTNDIRIWPARDTVQYYLFQGWDRIFGRQIGPPGMVQGFVRTPDGQPVPQARVLIASHDGKAYSAESEGSGHFAIPGVPAGEYVPIGSARGYADTVLRHLGLLHVDLPLESMGHYLLVTERTPAVDELFNLTLQFFQQHLH
ncbi:MAG: carboxypeptidase regulatory-like domain-containing protein [Herpetosiphonaceae bacterium]|nr:carboxypeptidase regulatory-like domain-containing protein [Herpetosiphonaceae bacterium]